MINGNSRMLRGRCCTIFWGSPWPKNTGLMNYRDDSYTGWCPQSRRSCQISGFVVDTTIVYYSIHGGYFMVYKPTNISGGTPSCRISPWRGIYLDDHWIHVGSKRILLGILWITTHHSRTSRLFIIYIHLL